MIDVLNFSGGYPLEFVMDTQDFEAMMDDIENMEIETEYIFEPPLHVNFGDDLNLAILELDGIIIEMDALNPPPINFSEPDTSDSFIETGQVLITKEMNTVTALESQQATGLCCETPTKAAAQLLELYKNDAINKTKTCETMIKNFFRLIVPFVYRYYSKCVRY